jgi:hypothetical protein
MANRTIYDEVGEKDFPINATKYEQLAEKIRVASNNLGSRG